MTARDPYFVKRGRVDGDRHIRVVDSSLRMMHNTADVYGNPVRLSSTPQHGEARLTNE
jgi:hypothetical protein